MSRKSPVRNMRTWEQAAEDFRRYGSHPEAHRIDAVLDLHPELASKAYRQPEPWFTRVDAELAEMEADRLATAARLLGA